MNEHHQPFEEIRHYGTEGQEFWSARELAPLLDYRDWRNFQKVLLLKKYGIMALKGKNFGQRENWHRYWIIGTGAIFKRYWPARLKRAKPAIKLHLTISLKPPKWLY